MVRAYVQFLPGPLKIFFVVPSPIAKTYYYIKSKAWLIASKVCAVCCTTPKNSASPVQLAYNLGSKIALLQSAAPVLAHQVD